MDDEEYVTILFNDQTQKRVKVIDLIDPRAPRSSKEQRQQRMQICNDCENINFAKQCSICSCIMPMKTWLLQASCPIGKW